MEGFDPCHGPPGLTVSRSAAFSVRRARTWCRSVSTSASVAGSLAGVRMESKGRLHKTQQHTKGRVGNQIKIVLLNFEDVFIDFGTRG